MEFFGKTNIDFLGHRRKFFIFSGIVILTSLILILFVGFRFGIDFTGGTELAIQVNKNITTDQLRKVLNNANVYPNEIKSYGEENQFLLRLKETGEDIVPLQSKILTSLKDYQPQVLKIDTIGPKIGKELRFEALIAVILAIIAILIYIGFRFEFVFGLGAIVALVHDVIVTLGMIIIFDKLQILNLEFNQGIVAALLTVVGYSVNNTVIIFDRIRENREKQKGLPLVRIANLSINETLSRTIITVLTTAIVLVIVVLFSGPVLQGFGFTMLVGLFAGTYSSFYISTGFVIWFNEKVRKIKVEEELKPAVTK